MVVLWLGPCFYWQGLDQLVRELRCHKPCSEAKQNKKPTTITAPNLLTNPIILAKIKGLVVVIKCPLTKAIHLLVHGT